MGFLRVILAQAKKDYQQFFFRYVTVFWFLILPLANGLLFYFMYLPFGKTTVSFEWFGQLINMDLFGFILTGQLLYSFYTSTLLGAGVFDQDRWWGTFEIIFLTPANRMAILLGNSVGTSLRYFWLIIGAIVTFTFFFQVGFVVNDIVAAILTLLFSYLALFAFGLLFSAFSIYSRKGSLAVTAGQEPVSFVSGVAVPQSSLPQSLAQAGYLIPLSIGLVGMRLVLLSGASLAEVQLIIVLLAAMALAYATLSYFLIRMAEKGAKMKGTLSQF